jgi:hypothetical protein
MAEKAELRRNITVTDGQQRNQRVFLRRTQYFSRAGSLTTRCRNLHKNASFPGPTPEALNPSLGETRESAF